MSTMVIFGYLALISATNPSRRVIPVWLVWSCTTRAISPEPPINSAILSAATPAALTLSVEAELIGGSRSEEHTSELQSHSDFVCRLLLDTKTYILTRKRIVVTP